MKKNKKKERIAKEKEEERKKEEDAKEEKMQRKKEGEKEKDKERVFRWSVCGVKWWSCG